MAKDFSDPYNFDHSHYPMIKKGISHLGLLFLGAIALLPLSVLYALADCAYLMLYSVFGYRKKVVRENLLTALPEKTLPEIIKIERKFYRYLASLIFEIIKMNNISKRQLQRRFVFKNKDLVLSYLNRGKSVLICSAHYGNWEWGTMGIGLNFTGNHYPIYKPLSNPVFDDWFKHIRSRFGNKLIAMRQTMRALAMSYGEASIFSFGNDQAPAKDESHYWTIFLNQPTSIQLGIEKIAKKTNRPIFYFKVKVLRRGYYEVDCVPLCLNPAETKEFEITEMHTRFLENLIREEPEYWLWSHRRWKYKPKQNVDIFRGQINLQHA
ncbi:lysophospholipid acyltransferase family protein [Pedobacter sandarakinus]|uniref:lysophospholipid acyltransferase family protein n=1 Tax=Pedobacter sandarakinus TaxID=353156 RepID=UPI0022475309|nr:lysophospholipid acyltransferase family protein [Pedobacter sandarakinus]MCX2573955.1 lysophospholipid acyltransferase family protein [Pedobacter sandarakinus]